MNKPKVRLVGLDGNAMSILAACRREARKAGWTQAEVADFTNQCMDGDFNALLRTVQLYFEVE